MPEPGFAPWDWLSQLVCDGLWMSFLLEVMTSRSILLSFEKPWAKGPRWKTDDDVLGHLSKRNAGQNLCKILALKSTLTTAISC